MPPAADGQVHGWLSAASKALRPASDSPDLDAELLLAEVLERSRAWLKAHGEHPVSQAEALRFSELIARRSAGEPVAYLLGHRSFMDLELKVGPGVLVPRPDTELLVETALEWVRTRPAPQLLDLGTGSGAVVLALAQGRPDARITGVEASAVALRYTRENAARLGMAEIELLEGSWYQPLAGRRFDCIVSNPPYLAADDPHLPDLTHEPRTALVAGPLGTEALAEVIAGAPDHLLPGGGLFVEHGYGQGAEVRRLMQASGLVAIRTRRDLAGHERVTHGEYNVGPPSSQEPS